MQVVYAFCRAVDDVADASAHSGSLPQGEREKRQELERWGREVEAAGRGAASHPVAVALGWVMARWRVPAAYFLKIIRGVEMDILPRRYPTFHALREYCEHVASAVGLISVRVFGCRSPEADRYATHLGIALQLTNILRDLPQDLEQGRLYLPREEMERFGCSEEELREALPAGEGEPFKIKTRLAAGPGPLLAFQVERAEAFFRKAEADCAACGPERRLLLPAQIMGGVYREVLTRVRETWNGESSGTGVRVRRSRQVWIAARCALQSLRLRNGG